ncbi:MAG: hypothetical protein AAF208_11250 [Cyanobacteria bacterium P01_A01_bin.45]
MENTQNVRHQKSGVKENQIQMQQAKAQLIATRNLMVHLLLNYPWLFVILLFGVFVSSAAVSAYSLAFVPDVQRPKSTTIQVEIRQPKTTSAMIETVDNPIPLWMVIAIAVSCASGCIILLRFLNRPSKAKRHQRHILRNQQARRTAQNSSKSEQKYLNRKSTVIVSQPNIYSQIPVVRVPTNLQPAPKVVPLQTIPLAPVRKESLADMLDVRKKGSLSTSTVSRK